MSSGPHKDIGLEPSYWTGNKKLDWALHLADSGLHVFPVCWPHRDGCGVHPDCGKSIGKRPIGELAPHGHNSATRDEDTIRRWWSKYPEANVAVSCGPSDLVVLDFDGEAGAELLADWDRRYILLSVRVNTPRGTHVWLAGNVASRNVVLPGLDVKSSGGYVVAPGSDGYELDRGGPIVGLPDDLAADLADLTEIREQSVDPAEVIVWAPVGAETPYALAVRDRECSRLATTEKGARYHQLRWATWRCCQFVAGGELDRERTRQVLADAAHLSGVLDDDPSLAERVWESVWRASPPAATTPKGRTAGDGLAEFLVGYEQDAARELRGSARAVVMAAIRFAYGFQSRNVYLSKSVLARATGLSRRTCGRRLNDLDGVWWTRTSGTWATLSRFAPYRNTDDSLSVSTGCISRQTLFAERSIPPDFKAGVSSAACTVLATLAVHPDLSTRELADRLSLNRGTVWRALRRLNDLDLAVSDNGVWSLSKPFDEIDFGRLCEKLGTSDRSERLAFEDDHKWFSWAGIVPYRDGFCRVRDVPSFSTLQKLELTKDQARTRSPVAIEFAGGPADGRTRETRFLPPVYQLQGHVYVQDPDDLLIYRSAGTFRQWASTIALYEPDQ